MSKIPVWMMIREAVLAIGGEAISMAEIRKYIANRYGTVNEGTIRAQTNACTVNSRSRVGMPENHKPRIASGKYDFLYSVGRGLVTLYNPDINGRWEIALQDGKPVVRQIGTGLPQQSLHMYGLAQKHLIISEKLKRNDIESPTPDAVRHYMHAWNSLENYREQESALNKLFWQHCPGNKQLDDVFLKTATLNAFYATNAYNVFALARHIVSLNIDSRLKAGDITLVTDIASGHGIKNIRSGKELHLYSFATKYCSHHSLEVFPVYDSYVEEFLIYLRDVDRFAEFNRSDLRDIVVFKRIIQELQAFYSLEDFTLKDIDRYLWQYGKEKFPKAY